MTWPEKDMLHISRPVTSAWTHLWCFYRSSLSLSKVIVEKTAGDLSWPEVTSGTWEGVTGRIFPIQGVKCIRNPMFECFKWVSSNQEEGVQTPLPRPGAGSVTSPQGSESLNACPSYTDWTIASKLSAIDISNSIYKTCVSKFLYRWPKVMSILRPLCSISRREKIERRLFCMNTFLNILKHRVIGKLDTLNQKIATSDPS